MFEKGVGLRLVGSTLTWYFKSDGLTYLPKLGLLEGQKVYHALYYYYFLCKGSSL